MGGDEYDERIEGAGCGGQCPFASAGGLDAHDAEEGHVAELRYDEDEEHVAGGSVDGILFAKMKNHLCDKLQGQGEHGPYEGASSLTIVVELLATVGAEEQHEDEQQIGYAR